MSRYEEIMQTQCEILPRSSSGRLSNRRRREFCGSWRWLGQDRHHGQQNVYNIAIKAVQPGEVLGLTFTRKAAGELAERVDRALATLRRAGIGAEMDPRDDLDRPVIATYNSFASEIASSYGMLIGADPAARLITDAERWQIMRDIVEAWPHTGDDDPFYGSSLHSITNIALSMAAALIDNQCTTDEARAFFDLELEALNLSARIKRVLKT